MSDSKKGKALKAEEDREDAAADKAEERKEDREVAAKIGLSNWERLVKREKAPEPAAEPFNPPKIAPVHFPRWVVADIPGIGEVPVVVKDTGEESAVKGKTATFKLMKSAQGDTYEVIA